MNQYDPHDPSRAIREKRIWTIFSLCTAATLAIAAVTILLFGNFSAPAGARDPNFIQIRDLPQKADLPDKEWEKETSTQPAATEAEQSPAPEAHPAVNPPEIGPANDV